MQSLSRRALLHYLKLEEDEDTAELLLEASLNDLGVHETPTGEMHYWSYPTVCGVAWAVLDAHDSLGMTDHAPPSVVAITKPREEHKMRRISKQLAALPVARRSKPAQAVWVPPAQLPGCNYHAAWYEQSSFEAAVRHYGAKVIKDNSAGPGTRYFFIQLTSGRYACIETHRDHPDTVIISLEVDTRYLGKHSGGKVHVCDIEEILRPMGGTFTLPSANLYIGWTTED